MAEEAPKKSYGIIMTNGTNDPLKMALAIVTGFGLRKNGHSVDFLMMGEAGSVIDEEIIRNTNGFGLPPTAAILDKPEMADCTWYVWQFCADARKKTVDMMTRKGKFVSAVEGAAVMASKDQIISM